MSGLPSRPRTATGAVVPQFPQARWRAGPLRRRHGSQTGWPSASRPETGLTLPQLVHAAASCQFRHRWHTPPPAPRNSGLPVRPQTAHAGGVRAVEPRAISSAASRPASGGAPEVSAAGSAASAAASRDIARLVGAALSAAASITGRGSDLSAAAAISTTVSLRQSGQPPRGELS
jgi:hypothetical protein